MECVGRDRRLGENTTMRWLGTTRLVLALALAVLLPLEQAHCMWMGLQRHASPVAAKPAVHACCAARAAASHTAPAPARGSACSCPQLPSIVVPASLRLAVATPVAALLAPPAAPAIAEPVAFVAEPFGVPDTGVPPGPGAPRAHGLRAPPAA
jgi:hypothetical protein